MLTTLLVLLAAAVVCVPLTRRFGFGSVLGYLIAGMLIGPSGLKLVRDTHQIEAVSELGVLMLLFLVGLELRPQRIWLMRRSVFGLGAGQVALAGASLSALAHVGGAPWPSAGVLGFGLALSSTAILLPMLAERRLLAAPPGRDAFAVSLFQDFVSIPLIAFLPFLAGRALPAGASPWISLLQALGVTLVFGLAGRFALKPFFRLIARTNATEVFTAAALLLVAGAAWLSAAAGLPPSLGAFAAGVMLSESEFRHELQADVEPFEGLLLGFFFISVGMGADIGLLLKEPAGILAAVAAMLAVKILVALLLGRLKRMKAVNAVRFSLALPQGSEFGFVLFAAAAAAGVLAPPLAARAVLLVALSMLASPILFAASERWLVPRLAPSKVPAYDAIPDENPPVLLCGLGRVGQIVARILRMQGIDFTALEKDSEQVATVRRYGTRVYFGDPTRADVLRAAGAATARLLVVAVPEVEESLQIVDTARRHFPHLKVVVRARNRWHVHQLMDREIELSMRETYLSSLALAEMALVALGRPPRQARREIGLFKHYDERLLRETHAFYGDEQMMIQTVKDAAVELADLLEADRGQTPQREGETWAPAAARPSGKPPSAGG